MKYFTTCLLLMIFFAGNAQLPSQPEYQALMAFYNATNGNGWTNNSGWSSADPDTVQSVQGWYGVTTDVNGHVTALKLNHNNLVGSIPSTIGALIFLKDLTLNNNQLTGSIPSSIGDLTNLLTLALQSNGFTGSIPVEIGSLNKLQYLYLSVNQLSGGIPGSIGNMMELRHFTASGNQFSGNIPASLGNLAKLQKLFLNANNLTGSIPAEFANLRNVYELVLDHNALDGNLPVIDLLYPQYYVLYINNNKFTFSNFLHVKQTFSGSSFQFGAQDSVDLKKIVQAPIGQSLTLTASVDRETNPASVYQWFKLVNGVSTSLNTAAASGHTHVVANITAADVGTKYYYTITNPDAPGLTLKSRLQTFQPLICTQPSADFQAEENNGTHTFIPSFTSETCTPTFAWDFGDGATSLEQAPVHAYTSTGTFTARLTINYSCGQCPSGQITREHQVVIENGFCGSIYCDDAGGVGIGTRMTEGFRLSVNGKIRASDIIKVYPQNQWSDFVFEKDYRLRPLIEVEAFIKKNGHLPEIPSAREVAKDGIDLGAMDAKLLQKIEELTLYLIRMHADMKAIDLKIRMLEEENKVLKQVHKK